MFLTFVLYCCTHHTLLCVFFSSFWYVFGYQALVHGNFLPIAYLVVPCRTPCCVNIRFCRQSTYQKFLYFFFAKPLFFCYVLFGQNLMFKQRYWPILSSIIQISKRKNKLQKCTKEKKYNNLTKTYIVFIHLYALNRMFATR